MRKQLTTAGFLAAALVVWAALAFGKAAKAEALVADLSNHLIAITTGFHGTDVLLFGATDGEGDVVVVVRGPEREIKVRRKARVGGIWVNTDEMDFQNVPAFYQVASSRELGDFAPVELMTRHQLGLDYLKLPRVETPGEEAPDVVDVDDFRRALIRGKKTHGFYLPEKRKVNFLGARLFRADVYFPPNVPTGVYTIEVLLIRDGYIAGAQTTPLVVSKAGLGAAIFNFAHNHAVLYGILAVALALAAGGLAGVVFRRV